MRLIGQEKWALTQDLLLKGPISSLIATQNQINSFKFTLCPRGAMRVGENTLYPLSLCNKKGKFLLRAKSLLPLVLLAHSFSVFRDRSAQPGLNISFWDDRALYPGFGTGDPPHCARAARRRVECRCRMGMLVRTGRQDRAAASPRTGEAPTALLVL